jgi:hypothetical protein
MNCTGIGYKLVGAQFVNCQEGVTKSTKKVKIFGSLSLLNFDVDVTNLLSTNMSLFKNCKLEILCKT